MRTSLLHTPFKRGALSWKVALSFVVLALFCKFMTPAGYMPGSQNHGKELLISLCLSPGSPLAAELAIDLLSTDEEKIAAECPFAAMIAQAAITADPVLEPIRASLLAIPLATLPYRAAPPLPALGPPLGARAPPQALA